MKIMIDPGHGGADPGAVRHQLFEKHIVLDVAKRVRTLLEKDAHDVRLTRTDDLDPWNELSLQKRCQLSDQFGADAFVSIHCNSFTSPSAHGSETFFFRGSYWGQRLARTIQDRLNEACPEVKERRVEGSGFYMLRHTQAPAALVELAFLSNPDEAHLLNQQEFRQRCAEAIALAIPEWWRAA